MFCLGFLNPWPQEVPNSIVVTGQEGKVSGLELSSHALSTMRWGTGYSAPK